MSKKSIVRLWLTCILAIIADAAVCVLAYMNFTSKFVAFICVLMSVILVLYAKKLCFFEKEKEKLEEKLSCESEQVKSLNELLTKEREISIEKLENERMEHQRDLVEQQKNAKERHMQLVSEIVHKFRMPISVAAGYADILSKDMVSDDEERKGYLEKISERMKYLNELLSRSIVSARDDNIADSLQLSSFDFVQLVKYTLDECSSVADEKGVNIQCVTMEKSIMVSADIVLMQHVIDNLIENSLKYMGRAGTITFTIIKNDNEIQLSCRDDGLGMGKEQAAHVFENGFRGVNSQGISGSGHGLMLINTIVSAHGGTCSAVSDYGAGMKIDIMLPILQNKDEYDNV